LVVRGGFAARPVVAPASNPAAMIPRILVFMCLD
jgi:hypothetical protein